MIYILNPTRGGKKTKQGVKPMAKKRTVKRRKSTGSSLSGKVKKTKASPLVIAKRRKLQNTKRYGSEGRYFRPKLMVAEDGMVYASPLAGGSYKVNPMKGKSMAKKRKSRKKYKRNPVALIGKRRRSYKRNPAVLKQAFSAQNIKTIGAIGIGFVGGIKAHKYINDIDALAKYRKFTGVIPFILGTVIAVKGKKKLVKDAGTGLSLAGLYDLVTQNIPQLNLQTVEGVDIDDESYYDGTAVDLDGTVVDLEGEDYDDDLVMGEDDLELVGEDGEGPYAMV
jgi:hypothetical protein